jgi:hypothetical protein
VDRALPPLARLCSHPSPFRCYVTVTGHAPPHVFTVPAGASPVPVPELPKPSRDSFSRLTLEEVGRGTPEGARIWPSQVPGGGLGAAGGDLSGGGGGGGPCNMAGVTRDTPWFRTVIPSSAADVAGALPFPAAPRPAPPAAMPDAAAPLPASAARAPARCSAPRAAPGWIAGSTA